MMGSPSRRAPKHRVGGRFESAAPPRQLWPSGVSRPIRRCKGPFPCLVTASFSRRASVFASKNTTGSSSKSTSCPSEAPGGWSIFRLCDDERPSGTLLNSLAFFRFSLGLKAGIRPFAPSYRAETHIVRSMTEGRLDDETARAFITCIFSQP